MYFLNSKGKMKMLQLVRIEQRRTSQVCSRGLGRKGDLQGRAEHSQEKGSYWCKSLTPFHGLFFWRQKKNVSVAGGHERNLWTHSHGCEPHYRQQQQSESRWAGEITAAQHRVADFQMTLSEAQLPGGQYTVSGRRPFSQNQKALQAL